MAKEAKETTPVMNRIEKRIYELEFTEPILGMSPLNKQLFTDFIASKALEKEPNLKPEDLDDEKDMIVENGDEMRGKMTGFHRDDDGVYLLDYQVRGFIKNAARNLAKGLNISALRSKVENFLFVFPRHIWLKEDVDGIIERPLKCDTPKGPRISLAASEMVKDVKIRITLHLFPHPELNWGVVEELLNYGQYEGISQWRGASHGRFIWSRVDDNGNLIKSEYSAWK